MKKTALITGVSRGIGLGIAIEFPKEGFDLVINSVRPEVKVTKVPAKLRAFGVQVIYCRGYRGKKIFAILHRYSHYG